MSSKKELEEQLKMALKGRHVDPVTGEVLHQRGYRRHIRRIKAELKRVQSITRTQRLPRPATSKSESKDPPLWRCPEHNYPNRGEHCIVFQCGMRAPWASKPAEPLAALQPADEGKNWICACGAGNFYPDDKECYSGCGRQAPWATQT